MFSARHLQDSDSTTSLTIQPRCLSMVGLYNITAHLITLLCLQLRPFKIVIIAL